MTRISKRKLASMIEEATVDAYNESEQAAGWHAMLEDQRDGERQTIPILDLPLPKPKPEGAEWIEAYRHWLGG